MEFGIQLANIEPPQFRASAQLMESLGFDLVCFPDHIVLEGPERQYDPHGLAYDMIVIAAAVMEATKKIQVGHLVLCNLFRHPVITAQSLTTLDHISGGRLLAGLGSGWTETEFEMTGIPFPPITERLRMLDEALTVIRSLWANERTTFNGEFYKLKDAILWPKPVQKPHPPIIVGGGGKGLLRIAAKHADYLNLIPGAGKKGHISLDSVKRFDDEVYSEKVKFVREEAKRKHERALEKSLEHASLLRVEEAVAGRLRVGIENPQMNPVRHCQRPEHRRVILDWVRADDRQLTLRHGAWNSSVKPSQRSF